MEPLIVWTGADLAERGATYNFTLDLACGIGKDPENDFEVALPEDIRLEPGSLVYIDGTQWGGYVIGRNSDSTEKGWLRWAGRTWHGMLEDRCLVPDAGQSHNRAAGTVADCIGDLLARLGLGGLFSVGECPAGDVSYTYKRYPNGLDALVDMLASADMRPCFSVTRAGGVAVVEVGASERSELEEVADSELLEVKLVRTWTPYNHVIALGQEEGSSRVVVNRYADAAGVVSATQTITGLAQRTMIYDYPNATLENLTESAVEKLYDEQVFGEVTVSLPDGVNAPLGDYIMGYDARVGEKVKARVEKQVVKVSGGVLTVEAEAGGSVDL